MSYYDKCVKSYYDLLPIFLHFYLCWKHFYLRFTPDRKRLQGRNKREATQRNATQRKATQQIFLA